MQRSNKLIDLVRRSAEWLKPRQTGPLTLLEAYSVYPFPSRLPAEHKIFNSLCCYMSGYIIYNGRQKDKAHKELMKRIGG